MNSSTRQAILDAYSDWRKEYIRALVVSALQAHTKGDAIAFDKLQVPLDERTIRVINESAADYSIEYGKLLKEDGASIIQGEKVNWLQDMEASDRAKVLDTIEQGIKEGKPTSEVGKEMDSLFDEQTSHAVMVARTETGRIMNQSTLSRYGGLGVTKVHVIDDEGPNSCEECAVANGQEWTVEYAQTHELEHPNCVRAFSPIVESMDIQPE